MINQAPCFYLFGKEASELYSTSQFSEELVNQSLDTLMRINILFLSRKENDGFVFIDPAAFNNQCHLYALFAARIKKDYKEKSEEEKLAKTEKNRFLHLSFFLSYTFLTDRKLLCQVIESLVNKKSSANDIFSMLKTRSSAGIILAVKYCALGNKLATFSSCALVTQ